MLHPAERLKAWKDFFIITLQSPWRHCSCNSAAQLALTLVGVSALLKDACGISISQKEILPFTTHWILALSFLFETGNNKLEFFCIVLFFLWLTKMDTFLQSCDQSQRKYSSTVQFKSCVCVSRYTPHSWFIAEVLKNHYVKIELDKLLFFHNSFINHTSIKSLDMPSAFVLTISSICQNYILLCFFNLLTQQHCHWEQRSSYLKKRSNAAYVSIISPWTSKALELSVILLYYYLSLKWTMHMYLMAGVFLIRTI